ncbi:hypothetical protein P3S68_031265 [Capsicum galapagoense]
MEIRIYGICFYPFSIFSNPNHSLSQNRLSFELLVKFFQHKEELVLPLKRDSLGKDWGFWRSIPLITRNQRIQEETLSRKSISEKKLKLRRVEIKTSVENNVNSGGIPFS